ncbi:MAG: GNAT family N-acetyltransferase, partial [bacterium]
MRIELWNGDIPWAKFEKDWDFLLAKSSFPQPFFTPTWYKVWFAHFGNPPEVKVYFAREDNTQMAGLGIFKEGNGNGEKRKISLLGSLDVWDYRDFIILAGREKEFLEKFTNFFCASPWDILELNGISEFSPTFKILPNIIETKGLVLSKEVAEVSLYIDLPASWDEFLANLKAKERHELRRKIRRLEKEEDFRVEAFRELFSPPEDIEKFFVLHRKSSREKAEFMTPKMESFFRDLAQEFYQRGWLDLAFLKIKGKEAAAFFSFNFQDTYYLFNSGYDPEYGRV